MGEFSIVSELSLQATHTHTEIWVNSAQHVQKSVSAALLVASAVRTITVILTIVGETANNQELFGCHSRPCLTGSHLRKSMLHEWQSPLFHLPPYLWHTHKHTQTSQQCAATTVSLGHLCSLPTQERWRVWWPKSLHGLPSPSPLQQTHHGPGLPVGWGEGWLSGTFVLLSAFRKKKKCSLYVVLFVASYVILN